MKYDKTQMKMKRVKDKNAGRFLFTTLLFYSEWMGVFTSFPFVLEQNDKKNITYLFRNLV